MRNITLKIMDSLMALFLAVVVGFFIHWLVGVTIGVYCATRILFPKPEALAPIVSPERKKALGRFRRRENEEDDHQRSGQYGAYEYLSDD